MNSLNKRNKSRGSAGGRSGRGGQGMRGSMDKSYLSDGVYSNPRFMHAATSIIGCVVQVQVRNGGVYEGVFKTFSPQLDVVLDMAHKLDDSAAGLNCMPSKERLIDTVIFHIGDVVMITSANTDLDYACKENGSKKVGPLESPSGVESGRDSDTFIDSAISSKMNGQIVEKELQRWVDDGTGDSVPIEPAPIGGSLEEVESQSGSGWDPNEMFRINSKKFNVESSYDPSLSQYTTQLKPENTKEYRDREARAAKIASEIERSDLYKAHIAMENGEGDGDEEDKFSAVLRTGDQSAGGSAKFPNRYVPPHMRKTPQQGRAIRPTAPATSPNRPQQLSSPNSPLSVSPHAQQMTPPAQNMPPPPTSPNPPKEQAKVNGNQDEKENTIPEPATSPAVAETRVDREPSPTTKVVEGRKTSNTKGRDLKDLQELKELRHFSTTFKLSDNDAKNEKKKMEQAPVESIAPSQPTEKSPEPEKKEPEDKLSEKVRNSTLNPNAKEFVFNPKPFTPQQQPMQIPTPPRPPSATQSPVLVQQAMPTGPIQSQPYYPPYIVPVSMQPTVVQQQQQQQQQPRFNTPAKRATVSVVHRHEFSNPAAQAAAATGQPLLAQPGQQPQYVQYMPMAPNPGIQQMVPMPGTTTRMQMPQGVVHNPGAEQQMQGQPQHVFVTPSQMTAHPMAPHPGTGQPIGHPPSQAHVTPHQHQAQHNQQTSHMNTQSGGGHPAPSPVHTHPQQPQQGQAPHPHQQPPASQTPQPHLIYQHPGMQQHPQQQAQQQQQQQPGQQQHPPLQPSPHTPTSPQSMYPPALITGYTFTSQAGMQGMTPAQMTYVHTQPHTTVTHAQHTQHSHAPIAHPGQPGHQQLPVVVMQQSGMQQHATPQLPQHIHTQPHMQPGIYNGIPHNKRMPTHQATNGRGFYSAAAVGQAGPPMVPQQSTINVSSAPNLPHPQMHYMHPQPRYAAKFELMHQHQ